MMFEALELENKKLKDEVNQLKMALQAKQVDDAAQATSMGSVWPSNLSGKMGIAGNSFHFGPNDFSWSTSNSTWCKGLDSVT